MKKYNDWKFHNFVVSLIKEDLDFDGALYIDTDRVEVEIDGDTVIYYIPVEFGHELSDIRLIIYPDFTYDIKLY